MIDHLPTCLPIAGPVVSAVRRMRVVHEERLAARVVRLSAEQGVEFFAIHRVLCRCLDSDQIQKGGEQVVNCGLLVLNGARWDGKTFLVLLVGVLLGPGGDEWHAHSTLIV